MFRTIFRLRRTRTQNSAASALNHRLYCSRSPNETQRWLSGGMPSCGPVRQVPSRPTSCTSMMRRHRLSTLMEETDPEDGAVRSLEDQYSRKTPLEHILLRPGMYIGPTERMPPTRSWVLNESPPPPSTSPMDASPSSTTLEAVSSDSIHMVQRDIRVVPALIKIFDEILVNASDQRLRHPSECTRLEVTIDPHKPFICVKNNGPGVPIQIHQTEQMYLPELLFGHLLTGSNFDDSQKRITGGRHGYGAKLTNIFSTWFQFETYDSSRCLLYRQTWSNNMQEASAPELAEVDHGAEDYTCISFVPDLARLSGPSEEESFGTAISPEDYALMCRRVVDVAGCNAGGSGSKKSLEVTLNGVDVSQASFADYCQLYRSSPSHNSEVPSKKMSRPTCFHQLNSRWTVGVGLSDTGSLEAVSFVNGMSTPRGGTHVNVLTNQICKRIAEKAEKMEPELAPLVTPGLVRRHLFLCVNALIENPTFDSQMKEFLTSSPNSFGSSWTLSDKFLNNQVLQPEDSGGPGILEEVLRVARGRQQASLMQQVGSGEKRTKRQLLSMIPKLEDAHLAGTVKGRSCTLILTEGDSAKALAVAGLEKIGRERFGVFPLRGKFLNVRHATVNQMATNGEIKALCAILGLDFDKEYDTVEQREGLRYGQIMLMTDQDNDGSHIKGLLINFIRYFWPKLLQPPVDLPPDISRNEKHFLSSFITPLLKATKKGKKGEILSFYSMPEFQAWRSQLPDDEKSRWSIKYYKGLGTSTPTEAKEYFAGFDHHHRPFYWGSDTDGELLDMVFDNKRASDRKKWILEEFDGSSSISVDHNSENRVSYEDFLNKEMIHFSHADNIRSIPSLVDGLKPSQRKILHACFKRNLKTEIKVAQLTGYCAEHTAYHHGEASLQSTIIGMAQDFVGSNNINLLVPSGQFGTRLTGGADAASPRYIFTQLSPIARQLFPEVDDQLLAYREDDGQIIEPEFYCPIIPLVLVNGAQGIGTGWSTFIPPHHPMLVLEFIRATLDGKANRPSILPHARGFSGSFETAPNGYTTIGRASVASPKSVLITELPLRCWTDTYKATLLRMRDRGEIQDFTENHTTTRVSFSVELKRAQLQRIEASGLEKFFRLRGSLPTTNMHAFDGQHRLQKFATAEDVADAFFPIRLGLYHDRKSFLESERNHASTTLRNRARFIEAVTTGRIELVSGRKSKDETVAELHNLGFATSTELQALRDDHAVAVRRRNAAKLAADASAGDDDEIATKPRSEFDYLLNMPLSSLTADKIAELREEAAKKDRELEQIQATSAEDLWHQDLDSLEYALKSWK